MKKIFENFIFENFKITENVENNKEILGVVEGKSFVLDGYSRNRRFYPKELWENALSRKEFQDKLKNRLVFGCIGHPDDNIEEDELLASGKVSHIVTEVWIDGDFGYARYEILNTPAGRILKTILNAGSKMNVSTRASGDFVKDENLKKRLLGQDYGKTNVDVINPNEFILESIDFVITPGIASVDVELIEKLEKNNAQDFKKLKESFKICEDGICMLEGDLSLYNNLKKEIQLKDKIIEKLSVENNHLMSNYNKIMENINEDNNEDNSKEKTDEEDRFLNSKDFERLIIILNSVLKRLSVMTNKESLTKAILNFTNLEKISNNDLTELKTNIENENFDEKEEVLSLIDNLVNGEKSNESFNESFNKIIDKIIEKEVEILSSNIVEIERDKFNENILNISKILSEEYQSKIKEYLEIIEELMEYKEQYEEIIEKDKLNLRKNNEKILKEKYEIKETYEEKIKELNSQNEKLNSEIKSLKEKYEEKIENLKEKFEKDEKILEKQIEMKIKENLLKEKYEIKESYEKEIKELKEKYEKSISSLKDMYENEIKDLKNSSEKIEENISVSLEKKLKIKEKLLKENYEKKLNELESFKEKYFHQKFKNLELSDIKETLKKYSDIKIIEKELLQKNLEAKRLNENKNDIGIKIVEDKKERLFVEKLI